MNDLISRQAAIDAIGKLSDEMYRTVEKGATFPTKAWFDGMTQAEHIVKNLPSAQQWIQCSERLPKEYAQYLVCYEDGECFVYWLEDADWARGVIEKEHIVAWMPLPEPYKGETDHDYERAVEQMEHDMLYEHTYNPEDGSM